MAGSPDPNDVLLVAATESELCGRPGFVCGVGPVEAAASLAGELAVNRPRAVLHVGVAGGRRLTPGALVVGTEAVYTDLAAEIPIVDRATPDPALVARAQAALPEAISLPIATSAAVSRAADAPKHEFRVEGMEGFAVLRACELAGVPAVEVRAISNDIGEGDRTLWMVRRGLEALSDALPRLLSAVAD
jgi:predicted 5'-methylthioadenosine/S-adenosylhomocysteine nucleosidase